MKSFFGNPADRRLTACRCGRDACWTVGSVAVGVLLAQAAPIAEAQSVAPGAATDNLQEVIVTARKQKESLLNVPQSITVLSDTTLTQLNVQSFDDYANLVPNLAFNNGGGSGGQRGVITTSRTVTLRGVQGANTTSLYIDDTPIPASQDPRIVDIQRIEVLNGPQGTLYGSSAIGGTIRIITNQPSLTQDSSKYMLQSGFTDHGGSAGYGGNAIANFVIMPDTLAVRVMGFTNHDSGYVTRIAPVTDGANIFATYKDQGNDTEYGGSMAALWQINPSFSANLKFLVQRTDYPQGWPLVYRGNPGFDPSSLTIVRQYNVTESSTDNWYLPALTLEYKRDSWDLVSSTSYFALNSNDSGDISEAMHQFVGGVLGYNNFGSVSGGGTNRELVFQQETRLSFQPTTRFSGIVGAYYSDDHLRSALAPQSIPGITGYFTPITGPIQTDLFFRFADDSALIQKAVFGELSYKLGLFTATAGVRKYRFNQPITQTLQGFIVNAVLPETLHFNQKEGGTSPRFTLTTKPAETTTLYTSAAKGFRPGGPGQTIGPSCQPDLEALGLTLADVQAGYKSDSIWTYELGAKQQINRRLFVTAAAFQTNWKGIQQDVTLNCGYDFIGNAGKARIRGGELELTANITDQLAVRAGYGYIDARITDNAGGTTGQAVGSPLLNVPKTTASASAMYTIPLSSALEGFVSGDWSYTGSSLSANNNSTINPAVRGAYSIINVRVGLRIQGANEISLYANNLTNKLADYGDHAADQTDNFLVNGVLTPHARVSVATPLTIGLQYRHGF